MENERNFFSSADIVKGEINETKSEVFGTPSSHNGKHVATGAAAMVATASLIGCSIVNEKYEDKLRAEEAKK